MWGGNTDGDTVQTPKKATEEEVDVTFQYLDGIKYVKPTKGIYTLTLGDSTYEVTWDQLKNAKAKALTIEDSKNIFNFITIRYNEEKQT